LEASADSVCGECVSSWHLVNIRTAALPHCRRVHCSVASAGCEIPSD